MKIAILGDYHGMFGCHENAMKSNERTLQIGDCGFTYKYMEKWDPENHKILGGNHDNYDELPQIPHYLGNFGTWSGIYFVRGAFSIDKDQRIEGRDWWANEELSIAEGYKAIDHYEKTHPEIMITHDAPDSAADFLLRRDQRRIRTRTGTLLNTLLDRHEPKLWIFGHWHRSKEFSIPGCKTTFRVLNEAEIYQLSIPDSEWS